MEDIPTLEEIRRRLFDLRKGAYDDFFEWQIGRHIVRVIDIDGADGDYIRVSDVSKTFDVHLAEVHPFMESYLRLNKDEPFKSYQPIQYNVVRGINLSNGDNMPVHHLCELIRFLYRLNNLTAFERWMRLKAFW